jgi:hypothetical protein
LRRVRTREAGEANWNWRSWRPQQELDAAPADLAPARILVSTNTQR